MPIKAHHFNTIATGGAAIGAQRIYDCIQKQGIAGTYFLQNNEKGIEGVQALVDYTEAGLFEKVVRHIKSRLHHKEIEAQAASKRDRYEKFSTPWQPIKTPYPANYRWPDVIHLHWISEMIDYESFFADIPVHIPIVWTLHDINQLTGGCHYTWGCEKYKTACNFCPQINVPGANDLSKRGFDIKLKTLKGRKNYVAANSNWTANLARNSRIFEDAIEIETIHYPVDTEVYKPKDKAASKQALKLPHDKIIVGFGAERLTNYRKGFDLLLEALKILYNTHQNIHVLVFGNLNENLEASLPNFTSVGFIEPGPQQANIYNAIDLFVIASREEAFGQTSLEAHACGTPVVGFNVGGVSDIVIHGETGFLANEVSAEALAYEMAQLISLNKFEIFGAQARKFVEQNYTVDGQGAKFKALYERALS